MRVGELKVSGSAATYIWKAFRMTIKVNPDPHAGGFTPQPIGSVTARVDDLEEVIAAIRALKAVGFSEDVTSVFIGEEGLSKLDLHGENHGMLARAVRALESLTAEERANLECETALKEGCMFVCVSTDGSDKQKATVNQILKDHNARNVKYFGRWTVEHL
jgi:hypothetical protein